MPFLTLHLVMVSLPTLLFTYSLRKIFSKMFWWSSLELEIIKENDLSRGQIYLTVLCLSISKCDGERVSRSLCPTLCDPTGCSLPGSSVHGILQARILEWVAIPFSIWAFQVQVIWLCVYNEQPPRWSPEGCRRITDRDAVPHRFVCCAKLPLQKLIILMIFCHPFDLMEITTTSWGSFLSLRPVHRCELFAVV